MGRGRNPVIAYDLDGFQIGANIMVDHHEAMAPVFEAEVEALRRMVKNQAIEIQKLRRQLNAYSVARSNPKRHGSTENKKQPRSRSK